MINSLRYLRDSKQLGFIYSFLVLSCCVFGITLLVLRILISDDVLSTLVATLMFFTTQSTLFITITVLLFLLGFSNKKWYKYLAFISLINIFITCLVFNALLAPGIDRLDTIQYMLHLVNPLLYIFFYFVFIEVVFPAKKFYIALIYPILYLISIYLWIEPIFGDMIEGAIYNFSGSRFVYPFLNPSYFPLGILGAFFVNLVVFSTLDIVLSLLLIKLKNKVESNLSK